MDNVGNTTWRKRTCEGLERDADVSPVSPCLQISLDFAWFGFVGVALFGWCVGSCWLLLSGKFDFFLHSFQLLTDNVSH